MLSTMIDRCINNPNDPWVCYQVCLTKTQKRNLLIVVRTFRDQNYDNVEI
jgi:hypothetical protein